MPRKRTTRVKATAGPKPSKQNSRKLSENGQGESSEQLEIVLKDFDNSMKDFYKEIRKEMVTMSTYIQTCYTQLEQSIPPELHNMTIKEFALAGGTLELASASVKQKEAPKSALARISEIQGLIGIGLGSVLEELNDEVDEMKAPLTTKFRSARPGKKMQSAKAPPSTTRTGRSKKPMFATPLSTVGYQWGSTPLITPKFDPQLPSTPENIREMMPGERLMSLAGSPVMVETKRGFSKDKNKDRLHTVVDDLTPRRVERILQLISTSSDGK